MSGGDGKLFRSLTRADVVAVATGAMFSSGFFLLPGVAAAGTGTSVIIAYVLAATLAIPPMLCQAELSTAMPRAGGSYFFLDRALGAWAGTVGGLGSWATLVLKTAFALFGFGAYVAFFTDADPRLLGIAGGAVFIAVNLVGAKESSTVQRWLVGTLVGVVALFSLVGLQALAPSGELMLADAGPFLSHGIEGLIATTALVSVSYAGLTKVASVAEEVQQPDHALPSGMFISLAIATSCYAVGVWVVVAAIPPDQLHSDLAPVATAASVVAPWIPAKAAELIVAVAALAAFLSTANAGIMGAARYPLAMARDGRLPRFFGHVDSRGIPRVGVWVTGLTVIASVAFLNVVALAKLASSFQMLLFVGTSLALIVMRESRIPSYQPGYRLPFYPLVPILGVLCSGALMVSMGAKAVAFPAGVIVLAALLRGWQKRTAPEEDRGGALRHVFRRLGAGASESLEHELGSIVAERALEDGGPRADMVVHVDVQTRDPWVGRPVRELGLPPGVLLVFVDRGHDAFVPDGTFVLEDGDHLTFVGTKEDLAELETWLHARRRLGGKSGATHDFPIPKPSAI